MFGIFLESRGESMTLAVRFPFRPAFPPAAKRLGGRWDPKHECWDFHPDSRPEVTALVDRVYGTVDGDDPSGENFASWTDFGGDDDGGMYDAFHVDVGDR